MQFPSLTGHAAELFRIIWKSPQPADSIASEYFRAKKYIGSKERKFISETVFAALRMKSLAEFSSKENFSSEENPVENSSEIKIILATILLGERTKTYTPQNVLHEMHAAGKNIPELVEIAAKEKLSLSEADAKNFVSQVKKNFSELDEQVEKILSKSVSSPFESAQGDVSERKENAGDLSEEEIFLLSTRYALPVWILQRWKENSFQNRSWRDAAKLGESLLSSAPVGLRVNSKSISRDEVLQKFSYDGIKAHAGKISPAAIILDERVSLQQNELFTSGTIEVQDEGSQLIGYAVAPEPKEKILDACAGAGGKTLHIADLQRDQGKILASDIEFKRLKEISVRARRAGLRSIEIQPLSKSDKKGKQNTIPQHLLESFDAVLVDAPCSGMGTVRRMPMAKWRLTPELLKKHAAKQLKILEEYAEYVTPGGILVYATCSLMPDENELVVREFLQNHPEFSSDPLKEIFSQYGIHVSLNDDDYMLALTPSEHGTDGFFMARMRKSL